MDHVLAACEIRKSTIRNAGSGVYLLEAALQGQILFKYGGSRIHFLRLIDSPKWFAKFKIALIIAVYWLKCLKLRAIMLGI